LAPKSARGYSQLAKENPEAMTSESAIFYRGRFSAVRTLSPKDSALIALSELPIEVPYHSVIGQRYPGPKEDRMVWCRTGAAISTALNLS
jgi:hypothetical protein